MKTNGFIGGGRITQLLLQRLHEKHTLPQTIFVSDPNSENLAKIHKIAADRIQITDKNANAAQAEIVFLAVHPPVFGDIVAEIKEHLSSKTIVVSLIPVITIEKMKQAFPGVTQFVRMIPNAPSLIGQGYNPVAFSPELSANNKDELLSMFQHWGETPEVAEDKLEAYAIITGMGPTYFWPQWLELQKLGKEFGLSEEELTKALPAMLVGAADLLFKSGIESEQVTDLIPVYPIKDGEETIKAIFNEKLSGLFQKLSAAKSK